MVAMFNPGCPCCDAPFADPCILPYCTYPTDPFNFIFYIDSTDDGFGDPNDLLILANCLGSHSGTGSTFSLVFFGDSSSGCDPAPGYTVVLDHGTIDDFVEAIADDWVDYDGCDEPERGLFAMDNTLSTLLSGGVKNVIFYMTTATDHDYGLVPTILTTLSGYTSYRFGSFPLDVDEDPDPRLALFPCHIDEWAVTNYLCIDCPIEPIPVSCCPLTVDLELVDNSTDAPASGILGVYPLTHTDSLCS